MAPDDETHHDADLGAGASLGRGDARDGYARCGDAGDGDVTAGSLPGRGDALPGLRVLAHPIRLQLLSLLSGTAMSAAEAARELNQTQANISYHLRRLLAAGLLVPAEEVSVRGGRAKRYRHPVGSAERLESSNASDHQQLAAAMASELVRRSASYRPGSPTVFTDAEFAVRCEDWDEARELARRLGELLHEAALKAAGSGSGSGDDTGPGHDDDTAAAGATVRVSATLFLFELLDGTESK